MQGLIRTNLLHETHTANLFHNLCTTFAHTDILMIPVHSSVNLDIGELEVIDLLIRIAT